MLENRSNSRILVVDRDESDCLLFGKVLRRVGYDVVEANSLGEALAAVSEQKFGLALLEVDGTEMPWEGIGLLRARQPLPVIAVAADLGERRGLLPEGCALSLEKPVDIRRLPWRVASVLKMRRRSLGAAVPQREAPRRLVFRGAGYERCSWAS
jgi:DNA-binding response OmpR family regulator